MRLTLQSPTDTHCRMFLRMFYPNGFLYMSLFPIIYQIKLNIELGLSDLIVKVASEKTVHRVKNTPQYVADGDEALTGQIKVAVEEKTESHQESPLHVQPTFGQLIKRPEWANNKPKKQAQDNMGTSSFDEEKSIQSYAMQSVPAVQMHPYGGAHSKDSF